MWLTKEVRSWDWRRGRPAAKTLIPGDRVRSFSWSPDGTLGATGDRASNVRLWDAATGEPVGMALDHTNAVNELAFTPDGRWLVAGVADGKLDTWDLGWLHEKTLPERLRLEAQAASGRRLNEVGDLEAIPPRELAKIVRRYHSQGKARESGSK